MYREAKYDRGGGPKMGNVVCSGTENKIQDCQHKGSDELPSHCTLLGDRIDIAIECEHSAYTKGILYLVSINGFTYKYSYLFIFTRFHSIQHLLTANGIHVALSANFVLCYWFLHKLFLLFI